MGKECVDYLSKVCDLMMVIALGKEFCKPEKGSERRQLRGVHRCVRVGKERERLVPFCSLLNFNIIQGIFAG